MPVGIGLSANSYLNLQAISGTTEGDDYFTSSFEDLGAKLQEIATMNCGSTLTVIKETQDSAGNTLSASAADWQFTATGDVVDGGSESRTTTESGANYQLTFPQPNVSHAVTVTETVQDGYDFQGVTCTNAAGPVRIEPDDAAFTVPVQSDLITSCTVVNRQTPASALVTKTWKIVDGDGEVLRTVHDPAKPGDDELPAGLAAEATLTGPGQAGATPQEFGVERTGYTTGGEVEVDESTKVDTDLLPNCVVATSELTSIDGEELEPGQELPYTGDLHAGSNSFGLTNTVVCESSLTLLKHVASGSALPDEWNLTAENVVDPADSTTVAGAEEASPANTFNVAENTEYRLSEALADPDAVIAYTMKALERCDKKPDGSCDWVEVDDAEPVSVDLGQNVSYRFVNEPLNAIAVPLTGGLSSDSLTIAGGIAALLAATAAVIYWRHSERLKRRLM